MANEYISREAAIKFFNEWADALDKQINDSVNYPHLRSAYKVCKIQLLDCIHTIKKMPAADVRPVVRGKWISCSDPIIPELSCYCSKCLRKNERSSNFCPYCGADMREEGTE